MHPAPWTVIIDGVGPQVIDAERRTVMSISHHDEDHIALWHRIVDAVNAREAKARTLPLASTEAVGAEPRSRGEIGDALVAPWRIVESPRAVNAHDDLVQALREIVIYTIEDDDRIWLRVGKNAAVSFEPNKPEASVILQIAATLRAALARVDEIPFR